MEKLMSFFEGFEIEKLGELLPSAASLMEGLNRWLALFVLVGPLLMLGFGIYYLFFAPKEANHSMGFRFGYAMSCVEVWQLTQRLAGIVYAALGLLLTVIIGLISLSFGKMAPPDMVWRAAKCLIWEVVLVLIATLLVDLAIVILFDMKGNPRSSKAKALTKAGKFSGTTRKTASRPASGTKKTASRPASGTKKTASRPASDAKKAASKPASDTTKKAASKPASDAKKTAGSTQRRTSSSGSSTQRPRTQTTGSRSRTTGKSTPQNRKPASGSKKPAGTKKK